MNADNSGARFSAVIVNYDGGAALVDCVRSIFREGVAAAQIIVVDNGSHDNSLANLAKEISGTTMIRNACNAGFARAVNQGLSKTTGDFVLLLNNDAQLQPGALRAFAEAFDRIPSLAIAGGQLLFPDGRLQNAIAPFPTLTGELLPRALLQWLSPLRFRGKTASQIPVAVESVIGACLVVRRSILPKLGLMDEDYFFFLEETEWCHRARQLGFEIYYLPGAQALHVQAQTANRFRSQARIEFQRSKLTFFRKTRSRPAYWVVSLLLPAKIFVNAAANTIICVFTFFLSKHFRVKAHTYWRIFAWHMLGRPQSWGLPGKCPQQAIPEK
ncbi:MAG TPA: glycosyltransferase family 2 protein [Candidatus Acidoferrales bacterium]|nr:glycosyltransferase family 2 protein [Candidatus Acidoferrales bacterium]